MRSSPEYWLRGPLPGIPSLLQPVAHALLQAREEVTRMMEGFPEDLLWKKPAGTASPGFHLEHLSGVLNRLFTYAQGNQLSSQQLADLKAEGEAAEGKSTAALVAAFQQQVDASLQALAGTEAGSLTQVREVGRAKLPSTVLGLLFHAAEHSMRHTGQLLVTVNVLKKGGVEFD